MAVKMVEKKDVTVTEKLAVKKVEGTVESKVVGRLLSRLRRLDYAL